MTDTLNSSLFSSASALHQPVLLREVVDALQPRAHGLYIDATFGRGGHTQALLAFNHTLVWAFDRDPDVAPYAEKIARAYPTRFRWFQSKFSDIKTHLHSHSIHRIHGILFDLGVSSPQLDTAERGFSFRADGPLDMRMSREGPSATDIVNSASETDLADIFWHLGDEKKSRQIARLIIQTRAENPITTTAQLATLIRRVVKKSSPGIDPATRTFQALRIYVNQELEELKKGLETAEQFLTHQGRLAVISFHSLEDRIVKNFLQSRSRPPALSRYEISAQNNLFSPTLRVIHSRGQTPSEEEIRINPRARSARLRVGERLDQEHPK